MQHLAILEAKIDAIVGIGPGPQLDLQSCGPFFVNRALALSNAGRTQ